MIVEDDELIGIITYTDIFRQLVTILGGGSSSIRLTIKVANRPGQLAQLADTIASVDGNIISVATAGKAEDSVTFTLRIEGVDWPILQKVLTEDCQDDEILHACAGSGCQFAAGQ